MACVIHIEADNPDEMRHMLQEFVAQFAGPKPPAPAPKVTQAEVLKPKEDTSGNEAEDEGEDKDPAPEPKPPTRKKATKKSAAKKTAKAEKDPEPAEEESNDESQDDDTGDQSDADVGELDALREDLRAAIREAMGANVGPDKIKEAVFDKFGVSKTPELNVEQLKEGIKIVKELAKGKTPSGDFE